MIYLTWIVTTYGNPRILACTPLNKIFLTGNDKMYLNFLGTLQTLMGLKKSHLHCHMHEIVVFLNGDGDSFSFLCLLGFSKVHFGALPYKTSNKEGKEKNKSKEY